MNEHLPWQCTEAIEAEKPSQLFALFSGGHDSVCSLHMAARDPLFTGVIHCNTGIGIEDTRDYVRAMCRDHDWPLYELRAPEGTYERLVLEGRISRTTGKRIVGFPSGPNSHNSFYWYLKQRQLRAFVQKRKRHRKDRIALVTGIRKQESVPRMQAEMSVPAKREGNYLWINPILEWSPRDKNDYMGEWKLRRNRVTDLVHRSGECLCGAPQRREELKEIAEWGAVGAFDDVAKRIYALENRAKAMGIDDHFWGMRSSVSAAQMELPVGPMCAGCEARAAA